jgi:amidase
MDTTAGSRALVGFRPNRDAVAISRLKAAGAIILAKANMAEFGLSPVSSISSLLGITRNPYALDRVPAGSSGGTAVAVAANFGMVGLGTDTGSSIRGPAAHNALVGLRPTMGMTSRTGMVPLNVLSDIVGPMARTVEDAAAVLQVIAAFDTADPATHGLRNWPIPEFSSSLVAGMGGRRIGILRQAFQGGALRVDPEVARVFARALRDMESLGARIVDSVAIEQVAPVPGAEQCRGLKYDLNEYLAQQGADAPVKSLKDILASGAVGPSAREDLLEAQASVQEGPQSDGCRANAAYRRAFSEAVTREMDRLSLDVLVYPTWSQPPQRVTQVDPYHAGQTLMFATAAGFPAITVPMGEVVEVLPAGLSFLGRAWNEETLFRLAYSFEQTTRHRRPPIAAPPIK